MSTSRGNVLHLVGQEKAKQPGRRRSFAGCLSGLKYHTVLYIGCTHLLLHAQQDALTQYKDY
jgi:hypothetical protein